MSRDFKGWRASLYGDMWQLTSSSDNRISSVIVPPRTYAKIYADRGYSGRVEVLNDDVRCLVDLDMNDRVTSAQVKNGPARGEAWLYEGEVFNGAFRVVSADTSYVGSAWNDRVSSVLTGPETIVDLYQHANYGGHIVTALGDAPVWSLGSLDNEVSSFRLRVVPGAALD